jgi:hypothetical protein
LLGARDGRLVFELAALVAEHGGYELPGWTGGIAPRSRDGHHAVLAGVRIEIEEPGSALDVLAPLFGGRLASLDESAFGRNFGELEHPARDHEVELVGISHADAAFDGMFEFGKVIGPGSLYFVADALHGQVGETVQGEGVQALLAAGEAARAYAEFAQEEPLGFALVKGAFEDVQQDLVWGRHGVHFLAAMRY